MQTQTNREQKGLEISDHVKRVDEHTYKVKSQSSNGTYNVISGELGWLCSCADHMFRGVKCKHIFAVELSLELRKTVVASVCASAMQLYFTGESFRNVQKFLKLQGLKVSHVAI